MREADRAGVDVRLVAEGELAAAEHLRPRAQLDVDLEPDHGLVALAPVAVSRTPSPRSGPRPCRSGGRSRADGAPDLRGVRVGVAEDDDPPQPADRVVDAHEAVGMAVLDDDRDLAEPLGDPRAAARRAPARPPPAVSASVITGAPANPMPRSERVGGVEQLRLGECRRRDLEADRQLGPAARRLRRARPGSRSPGSRRATSAR